MGVVSPEVGVVSPGVGVVRTDVEANGEEDTERWEPGSFSNGEDLKCPPPPSAPQEDLKWAPASTAEHRKLTPSGEGEKQKRNQEKLTAVTAEPDSAAGRQGGREVGSKSQSKLTVTRRSEVRKSTQ